MLKVYEFYADYTANNGLGTLTPASCIETKKAGLDGWSIEVTAPIEASALIVSGRIVTADTMADGNQPFVIGSDIKRTNTAVTFTADHLVFSLADYIVLSQSTDSDSGQFASPISWMQNCKCDRDPGFTYTGRGSETTSVKTLDTIRNVTLIDAAKTACATWRRVATPSGKTLDFTSPDLLETDSNFTVAYGRNIEWIEVGEDWSDVVTRVIPTTSDGLTIDPVDSSTQYSKPRTKVESFEIATEDDSGNKLTDDERKALLKTAAEEYLAEHATPAVGYSISLAGSAGTRGAFKIFSLVTLKHPLATAKLRCIGYTYNTESRQVLSITLGDYDPSAIAEIQRKTKAITENQSNIDGRITALENNSNGSTSGGDGGTYTGSTFVFGTDPTTQTLKSSASGDGASISGAGALHAVLADDAGTTEAYIAKAGSDTKAYKAAHLEQRSAESSLNLNTFDVITRYAGTHAETSYQAVPDGTAGGNITAQTIATTATSGSGYSDEARSTYDVTHEDDSGTASVSDSRYAKSASAGITITAHPHAAEATNDAILSLYAVDKNTATKGGSATLTARGNGISIGANQITKITGAQGIALTASSGGVSANVNTGFFINCGTKYKFQFSPTFGGLTVTINGTTMLTITSNGRVSITASDGLYVNGTKIA